MRRLTILSRGAVTAVVAVRMGLGLVAVNAAADDAANKAAEPWVAPARAAKKKNPIPAEKESIAAGKKVYEKECLSCHGKAGKGDGPAAKDLEKSAGDLSKPEMWQQTDGALYWKLTEGKKPMPTYEKLLKEDERWHVVNFMRTLAPKPKDESKK